MKVLWVCNIMLPMVAEYLNQEISNKEGWLTGLADTILKHDHDNYIELAVAFPFCEEGGAKKWTIPAGNGCSRLECYRFTEDTTHPEVYDIHLEEQMREIIEDFRPDIVHCFGTEFPHTLAVTKVCEGSKVVIGIQGVCEKIAEVYLADLPERVVKRVTFRDFLRKDSILQQKEKFVVRGLHEREALERVGHVIGRTQLDKTHTTECNPSVNYYFLNETLRPAFYEGEWQPEGCERHSMFLSQGDYPLKGLHYVLKAMPRILDVYPDAKLYVAGNPIVRGNSWKGRLKMSSYGKYITELLEQLKLGKHVVFLGKLSETEMKERFLKSALYLCASSIENSPNSLGEAMLLGLPCVTAAVGGIPSVFQDGFDGIAYPGYGASVYEEKKVGDMEDKEEAQAAALADAVLEMWSDESRMKEYGKAAALHARITHDSRENYARLMEIYREIAGSLR